MGHEKTINAVRVSTKEELIATCSHDRTVKVWDKDLRNLFTLAGHRRGVWDAAFHEKEAVLVTAGGDGMLKGWSMIDGSCIWSMGEGSGLVRCQWIYEHQVVTSSVDGILKIWDVRKKTSLSYDKHEGKIWALEVRKNEKGKCEIATGANDSVYQIWVDSTEQTRDRIMKQGELDQKERILLEQFRFEKQYLEAAKVAFDGNYSQMFMHVLHEMLGGFDETRQVEMDEDGRITQEPQLPEEDKISSDLRELVNYTLERDASRLLNLVLTMNSTVRHFKTANRLLLEI
jgi:WD40 repeat protein